MAARARTMFTPQADFSPVPHRARHRQSIRKYISRLGLLSDDDAQPGTSRGQGSCRAFGCGLPTERRTCTVMLKVELHTHTSDDPIDCIPHSPEALIDRAAALGYDALAITLHERQHPIDRLQSYAADRGITLIPGVERTIEGRHVLLLDFQRGAEGVCSFDELARLKRTEPGLVVAPHPFFPTSTCLARDLERRPDLFDAVEINAMFTASLDFNRRARAWARDHGKPLVGNGDVHDLRQLGTTYSLVDAEPTADAICDAIRVGRVQVECAPLRWSVALSVIASMYAQAARARVDRATAPRPSFDPAV